MQVNATDYDGRIVIETFEFHGCDERRWAVPGWFEDRYPELCGPFASTAEAESVMAAYGFKAAS